MIDRLRTATNGDYVLGGGRFQSQIAKTLGRRAVPGEAERPRSKSWQEIKGQNEK
jgi:putative transposase